MITVFSVLLKQTSLWTKVEHQILNTENTNTIRITYTNTHYVQIYKRGMCQYGEIELLRSMYFVLFSGRAAARRGLWKIDINNS